MKFKEKADVFLVLPASNLTHPFEVKHTQEFFLNKTKKQTKTTKNKQTNNRHKNNNNNNSKQTNKTSSKTKPI